MKNSKKIEILKLQLSKIDQMDFEFRSWYDNTTNLLNKIFDQPIDRIAQVRACMNRPEYAFSGISVDTLKKDWRKLLNHYIEEIQLFEEDENEEISVFPVKTEIKKDRFVDTTRIDELESLESPNFDFTKLLQLCYEIDSNYANSSDAFKNFQSGKT